MSSKNFMSYEDAATVLGAYANTIKNKQDVLLYGGVNPSSGADGDMYVKLARDESTLFDMFGSPTAESTDDYEMSYTVDSSVMGDYYDYEAFGTGKGFGQNGRGSMTITYHFKNSKFKPANVSYCNNFSLSGGGYLESANFAIKASNDCTNWDTLYSTNTACPRDTSVSADITTNTYYSYFKFEMNSGGGYTGIKNIVMNGISESYSNIDNIYFKNDGTWLKDAFAKKSDLDAKQDTLTFDNAPTENSNNPVKSGGIYTALADKQDALTAGNYISIANDGTINVTQGIGVYDVYSYEIKSINSGYSTKITKRKNGVFVSEQEISNGAYSSDNRLNVDDRFEFWYTFAGYLWHYKLLVDSNEHQKDEEVSWEYSTLVDYTETFNVSQDSSTDLATKGDIEAAISSAYHHAGTKTCAELVAGLLVAGNEGNVYNMTDSGTTTADFIEGAGQPIKAGDNVGIAKISDGVYKFDLLSGFVDTTNFVQKSQTAGLLKNDGTVDTTIRGDVSTLKSGLTNLDNEVNGDATVYPYADVIAIEDAVPSNLADCNVKIEPVQNLHGYDKPWVGGAGKNKLPLVLDDLKTANTDGTWSGDTYTLNGVSFTILKDVDGNVTGVKTGNNQTATGGNASFNIVTLSQGVTLESGQYIGNGCPANGSTSTYYLRFTGGFDASSDIGEGTGVKTVTTSAISVYIRVTEGATVSDLVFTPMIRLSTETDATFAPYTNICPITGHTEASVQRDGNNLFDSKLMVSPTSTAKWVQIELLPNTTYTVSSNVPNSTMSAYIFAIAGTDTSGVTSGNNGVGSGRNQTVTTGQDGIISFGYRTNGASGTINLSEYNYQIELGSSATDYEPYQGKTYTIALGDTIYGGTVDFDSGVMTVDRKSVDLGLLDFTYDENQRFTVDISDMKSASIRKAHFITSCYLTIDDGRPYSQIQDSSAYAGWNGTAMSLSIHDSRYSDAATYKTAITGQTICYELATHTTIQLTPQQIQLLKGTNTLTASTGQISVTVNGVSGAIGGVQEQVNELGDRLDALDEYVLGTPVKIGKWFDSILYRKVISFGSLPDNNYWAAQSGLSNVAIVNIRAFARSANATIMLNYPDCKCYYNHSNDTVVIATSADFSSYTSCYVVLEYYERPNS